MTPLIALLVIVGSTLLSLSGAWIVARRGRRFGLVDIPTERSSHRRATPKGGGIGIAAGVVFTAILAGAPVWSWAPALGISLLGLAADRFEIAPGLRLLVEFLLSGFLVSFIGVSWGGGSNPMGLILLAVFIVGTTNFFNFMDGIDGIAALTGVVGFGLLAFSTASGGADPFYTWLAIGTAMACAGFLPLNLPAARVFMGDAGSLLLGFLFATIAVGSADSPMKMIGQAACLFPFYLDELSTMALRWRDGQSLTRPHRRHLYQLLANERGIAHWKVSAGYGTVQLVVGIGVLGLIEFAPVAVLPFLGVCAIGFLGATVRIRRVIRDQP